MARQLLPILALFVSTAFLMAGGGVHAILIPVRAQMEGFTNFQIGLIGTGWAIGFTAGCILVPLLVRRVGHVRSFGALAATLCIVMLLNGMVVEAYSWVVLRGIAGLCFSGSYMIVESWLNERITNANRGTMFSLYMIVTQTAYMGGQYVLTTGDPSTHMMFMYGAILYALAVIPTALSKAQSPQPLTKVRFDLRKIYSNSPAAAVGAVLAGMISSAWGNFAPVFGLSVGMSNAEIASLIAVALVGSVVFQYPIGKLSDMVDRRYVMIGVSLFGAVMGLVLSGYGNFEAGTSVPFFTMVLMFGGVIYPIYALVVAHANDFAEQEDFVEISAGLLMLFGFGTMVGPLLTATVMDWLGVFGLFATIGGTHVVLALFISYRTLQRSPPADVETVDFQAVAVGKAMTPESYVLDPRSFTEDEEEGEPPRH